MRCAASALLGVTVSGCYAYTPLNSASATGTTVSFVLTDAGRVALGQNIGAEARAVEGEIESATDSGYVLHVTSVSYINGQTNAWTGERLAVRRQDVTDARKRTFSKSRTALLAAVGVGGAMAFIASRHLLGGGPTVEKTPPPGGPPPGQ